MEQMSAFLEEYIGLKKEVEEKNRNYGSGFNIISMVAPDEPMHSYLLERLLNPHSSHGQGKLFLKIFLEKLGIESPEEGHWEVTAEKGRVDILLKRKHPHSVIVIENKSNYAVCQPNQMYRYWYYNIFLANGNEREPIAHTTENLKRYQVIYLSPAEWKQPEEHSTECPLDWLKMNPTLHPKINYKTWCFHKEIKEWLDAVLVEIPSTNHRLREYILQYIEHWKLRF